MFFSDSVTFFLTGMEFDRWELHGQMVLNMWLSVQSSREQLTRTGTPLKIKKARYGGMLIADGSELLSMVHLSSCPNSELHILSLSPTMKFLLFLVMVSWLLVPTFNSTVTVSVSSFLTDGNSSSGEWWNRDIISVMRQALFTGAAPNVSDAYTINGQPGDLYACSSKGYSFIHKTCIYICMYIYLYIYSFMNFWCRDF